MDKHAVFSTDHWPLRFAYGGHLDMGNCNHLDADNNTDTDTDTEGNA